MQMLQSNEPKTIVFAQFAQFSIWGCNWLFHCNVCAHCMSFCHDSINLLIILQDQIKIPSSQLQQNKLQNTLD